jgi:dihydrodipicolinate synthase/N-acetylneuraminate lyase
MWLSAKALGAEAFIPGLANAFPEICCKMYQEGMMNNFDACCNSEMKYATRPKFTLFNGIAFYNTFGIKLRDWKIALKECIESISKS